MGFRRDMEPKPEVSVHSVSTRLPELGSQEHPSLEEVGERPGTIA